MARLNKEQNETINKYIMDNIDFSDYNGIVAITEKEKLYELNKVFLSEMGFRIAQVGKQNALIDWLKGLPSVINIYFCNDDILNFAEKIGSLKPNATEKEQQKILNNWFNLIASRILKLMQKYKIEDKINKE